MFLQSGYTVDIRLSGTFRTRALFCKILKTVIHLAKTSLTWCFNYTSGIRNIKITIITLNLLHYRIKRRFFKHKLICRLKKIIFVAVSKRWAFRTIKYRNNGRLLYMTIQINVTSLVKGVCLIIIIIINWCYRHSTLNHKTKQM